MIKNSNAALGLVFTVAAPGCADPALGVWTMSQTTTLYNGCTRTVTATLDIADDFSVTMEYQRTNGGTGYYCYGYNNVQDFEGYADLFDGRLNNYKIRIKDSNDPNPNYWSLPCSLSDDKETLDCAGFGGGYYGYSSGWIFKR